MAATLGELGLVGELRRLRAELPAGSRSVLDPAQTFAFKDVKTATDAILELQVRAVRVVKELRPDEVVADHPAIGALAVVMAHPDADPSGYDLLPAALAAPAKAAVEARKATWSVDQLEWQWAQYAATVGEGAPLNPQLPLARQVFAHRGLAFAWAALMDLEVLRAWGLVT